MAKLPYAGEHSGPWEYSSGQDSLTSWGSCLVRRGDWQVTGLERLWYLPKPWEVTSNAVLRRGALASGVWGLIPPGPGSLEHDGKDSNPGLCGSSAHYFKEGQNCFSLSLLSVRCKSALACPCLPDCSRVESQRL